MFSSLIDLNTHDRAKKGKNCLVSSIGCKKKKHDIGAKLNFDANPVPGRRLHRRGYVDREVHVVR